MTYKLMLAFAFGLVAVAAPAAAQDAPGTLDSRWAPYVGCWKIVQEQLGDQAVPLAPGTQVCAKPAGRSGLSITTTVDGKNVLEQTIIADGTPQTISQGDCSGTQTSEWSRDGDRLFTRAEIACTGRPARTVSGITLLAKGQWVDAQATLIDGNQDVRVRRYQRISEPSAAVLMGTGRLTLEDIIEASAKVQSEAVEAAIDAAGSDVSLSSRTLKQLADNGVSPNVIDLMVAQTYPDRFRVERPVYTHTSGGYSSGVGYSSGSSSVYIAPPYPFADVYDPFFYNSYYYSPFAYPYYWGATYSYRYPYYRNYYNFYGYPGSGYYYGGVPSGGGAGGGSAQPGGGGSRDGGYGVAVRGRGYTRVAPNAPAESDSGGAASRTRSTGGVRGVDSSSSSSSGSSSSSSGSSAGSGGYSSGGGGDSGGGRTAQPR